jgi:hypothetical protein
MALLDTASLIVTPNGYKAEKLYSIVPSDGTGDMTFARTGDTATRVNSSGLIEGVNANIPRLDYLDGTCPKLLLEPQRTNLITYSDQFDQVTWVKINTTVLSNQIASPDGTINADKLTNNNTSNDDYIEKFSMPLTAGTYTASIFVKNSDATTSAIRAVHLTEGTNASEMTYTWATNTFTITGSNGISGKVTSYGNGWVRLQFTYSIGTVTDHRFRFYGQGFTTSSKFVYIYGAQVELGTFATSYIPTTTASVTRNVDGCTKSSITSLIGQTEGTIFADLNLDTRLSYHYLFVRNAGVTNYLGIKITASLITAEVVDTNVVQAAINLSNSSTGRFKIAVAYKANDFVLYINGALVGTDTSGTVPICDTLDLYYNNTNKVNLNSTALWKTRLTNLELAQLTTL